MKKKCKKTGAECPSSREQFGLTVFDPFCGTDGVTYGNEWELKEANCHDKQKVIGVANKGECKQDGEFAWIQDFAIQDSEIQDYFQGNNEIALTWKKIKKAQSDLKQCGNKIKTPFTGKLK